MCARTDSKRADEVVHRGELAAPGSMRRIGPAGRRLGGDRGGTSIESRSAVGARRKVDNGLASVDTGTPLHCGKPVSKEPAAAVVQETDDRDSASDVTDDLHRSPRSSLGGDGLFPRMGRPVSTELKDFDPGTGSIGPASSLVPCAISCRRQARRYGL